MLRNDKKSLHFPCVLEVFLRPCIPMVLIISALRWDFCRGRERNWCCNEILNIMSSISTSMYRTRDVSVWPWVVNHREHFWPVTRLRLIWKRAHIDRAITFTYPRATSSLSLWLTTLTDIPVKNICNIGSYTVGFPTSGSFRCFSYLVNYTNLPIKMQDFTFSIFATWTEQKKKKKNVVLKPCPFTSQAVLPSASVCLNSTMFPRLSWAPFNGSRAMGERRRCKRLICWGDTSSLRGVNVTPRWNDSVEMSEESRGHI